MGKVKLYTSKAWLTRKLYVDKMTPEEIATEQGVGKDTIYRWMQTHGLKKP